MTAGSGIIHQEMPRPFKGNMMGFQLWVNLPAKVKMSPPKYQAITGKEMGRYELPDGAGVIEVISGNYEEVKGPAFTFTPVTLINAKLENRRIIAINQKKAKGIESSQASLDVFCVKKRNIVPQKPHKI